MHQKDKGSEKQNKHDKDRSKDESKHGDKHAGSHGAHGEHHSHHHEGRGEHHGHGGHHSGHHEGHHGSHHMKHEREGCCDHGGKDKRWHDEEHTQKSVSLILLGLGIGTVLGALFTLFLMTNAGHEARKMVLESGRSALHKGEDAIHHANGGHLVKEMKDRIHI